MKNIQYLEHLVADDVAFALYRLPGEKEPHCTLQTSTPCKVFHSLNDITDNEAGFIFAPFLLSATQPAVLIPADIQLSGWAKIDKHFSDSAGKGELKRIDCLKDITSTHRAEYTQMFELFQKCVEQKQVEKLVLSRTKIVNKLQDISLFQLFAAACDLYPESFVYLCFSPQSDIWMGATPEILLTEQSNCCKTTALAGTQTIDNQKNNALSEWNEKNVEEQSIVVQYLRKTLDNKGISFSESETYTVIAGNLAHRKTDFSFVRPAKVSIGALLNDLHPTPAVAGFPKAKSVSFILENERHNRQYYSGFAGGLNLQNQIQLFVNLRCMQIFSNKYLLYAGGGILSSSVEAEEWNETEAKMQVMQCVIQNANTC